MKKITKKVLIILLIFATGSVSTYANHKPDFTNPGLPGERKEKSINDKAFMLSGKVSDVDGRSLPGVSIMILGDAAGVMTDEIGNYTISVPNNNSTIVISYVGYATQEIITGGNTLINITLLLEDKLLSDVVVVGYGQQRARNVTSAVSVVKGKELMKSPVANTSNALPGRVTGLTFIQDQGAPGQDETRLYVRGLGTTGNLELLYVIDGIPRTGSDFNKLTPGDIESISVLKDAASAAVFGARGANGVILVTTRRGKAGKPSFSYTFNYGIQKPTRLPHFVNAYDYVNMVNEASNSDGTGDVYPASEVDKYKDGKNNVNWVDSAFGNSAPMQQHNLTVNGGSEKVKYFVSFNYLNQKGLFPTTFADRYNFRSNIDAQVTNTTKIAFDVSGSAAKNQAPSVPLSGIISNLYRELPTTPIRHSNGLFAGNRFNLNNIANITESGYERNNNNALLTRLEIRQEIPAVPGLSLKGIAAYDYYLNKAKAWVLQPKLYQPSVNPDGTPGFAQSTGGRPSLAETWYNNYSLTMEAHAMYNRTFGSHAINALVLYTRQSYKTNYLYGGRNEFLSEELEILDVGSSGPAMLAMGGASISNREGLVGRIGYAFKDKYLIEGNFRYDASDIFGPGHRGGFFPSASVGWVLSEENFLKPAKFLDYLKIRASYGQLGNDRIGGPQYLDFYQFAWTTILGDNSTPQERIALSRMANPNITWETVTKANIGFDAKLFKGFSIEADYFEEKRKNILGQRSGSISSTTGISGALIPFENFAKVDNKGFELSLSYQKEINQHLNVFGRFNVSHAKNTIIDIGEPTSLVNRLRSAGHSLYSQFGLVSQGYYQSQKEIDDFFGANLADYANVRPGDIKFKDVNNDQKIDGEDREYIGTTNLPLNIYGFSAGVNFKGIELSMLLQAGTGNQQQLGGFLAHPFSNANPPLELHKDHWTPNNPNAAFPRLTFVNGGWNFQESDFWLNDNSYLRLKNFEAAYSFPKSFTDKINAQGLRMYANGVNLLTFTKYSEIDPENTNGQGGAYPQQVVINLGVQITF